MFKWFFLCWEGEFILRVGLQSVIQIITVELLD